MRGRREEEKRKERGRSEEEKRKERGKREEEKRKERGRSKEEKRKVRGKGGGGGEGDEGGGRKEKGEREEGGRSDRGGGRWGEVQKRKVKQQGYKSMSSTERGSHRLTPDLLQGSLPMSVHKFMRGFTMMGIAMTFSIPGRSSGLRWSRE